MENKFLATLYKRIELSDNVFIFKREGVIKEAEIDLFLETRHLNAKARRSGKYEKGPKKLKSLDKMKFSAELKKILSKIEGFLGRI